MNERNDVDSYIEFAHQYQKLTPWNKLRLNFFMVGCLLKNGIEQRSWSVFYTGLSFAAGTIWLFPYTPSAALALAALAIWAWAMATSAGALWLAAAALATAAIIKRPQLEKVEA